MNLENKIDKDKIQLYIIERKWTKKIFCQKCGFSYMTLKRALDNEYYNMRTLYKIARMMNVKIKELFE